MPEIRLVQIPIRGHSHSEAVPVIDPDSELAGALQLAAVLQMITQALVALEDPKVDAVLEAHGFELHQHDEAGQPVRRIFPPEDG